MSITRHTTDGIETKTRTHFHTYEAFKIYQHDKKNWLSNINIRLIFRFGAFKMQEELDYPYQLRFLFLIKNVNYPRTTGSQTWTKKNQYIARATEEREGYNVLTF